MPVSFKVQHGILTTEMWDLCIKNRLFAAGKGQKHLFSILILLTISLVLIFATGCTRPASKQLVIYATDNAPRIVIDRVQVSEGSGVYISGRSTLPDGECIQTELLENQQVLAWWPRDVCVEIAEGRWEFLTALGRSGAPERLDPDAEYLIHAWWPKQPEAVDAQFPFDLSGPPPGP